jgi:hypothetical protein
MAKLSWQIYVRNMYTLKQTSFSIMTQYRQTYWNKHLRRFFRVFICFPFVFHYIQDTKISGDWSNTSIRRSNDWFRKFARKKSHTVSGPSCSCLLSWDILWWVSWMNRAFMMERKWNARIIFKNRSGRVNQSINMLALTQSAQNYFFCVDVKVEINFNLWLSVWTWIYLPLQLKILAMTEHMKILLLRWLSERQIHLALNEWAIHSPYAIAST